MANKTLQTERTSAADKSIGFDFQYYHFLWRLLTMKSGESVGLEVMDDVHTELADSRQILVQLKHSLQTKADGSTKNLTTLDVDLWKSLSNWSKIIIDPNACRSTLEKQHSFITKTDFLLVSNKTDNENNTMLLAIKCFQAGEKSYSDLKEELAELFQKTESDDTKSYINDVLSLDDKVAENFFRNLAFDLGDDDIIQKCKMAIRDHHIDDSKIDEVFSGLDSRLREENFSMVKKGEKIIISSEDFRKKYRIYFDRARNDKLAVKEFTGILPDCLEDQRFIKQLIDVQDIPHDDKESMAEFTRHLLYMQNNIDEWHRNGDITQHEIDTLKKEAKSRWTNEFRSTYRQCSDEEIMQKALKILDAIRKERLPIAHQELPTDMSNGQFYDLSNIPEIGWHRDWEKKYK